MNNFCIKFLKSALLRTFEKQYCYKLLKCRMGRGYQVKFKKLMFYVKFVYIKMFIYQNMASV